MRSIIPRTHGPSPRLRGPNRDPLCAILRRNRHKDTPVRSATHLHIPTAAVLAFRRRPQHYNTLVSTCRNNRYSPTTKGYIVHRERQVGTATSTSGRADHPGSKVRFNFPPPLRSVITETLLPPHQRGAGFTYTPDRSPRPRIPQVGDIFANRRGNLSIPDPLRKACLCEAIPPMYLHHPSM